ncbi:MAG TPA: discoidin domain-containing protein, partial [Phycisphaerales bacterium]|nr:discoidin domain-containing protein [Phycisphaerales bacterium]
MMHARIVLLLRLALCVALGLVACRAAAQPLMDGATGGQWSLVTSHQSVQASLEAPVGTQRAMGPTTGFTLLYNFTQGSGFAIAQLVFPAPIELPENYELSFTLTGKGLPNALEVKLLDAPAAAGGKPGESVWWVKRRSMAWPESPGRVVNKAKHFQFAWGPLNGQKIRRLAGIEIVVASSSGGSGAVTVTDLEFRRLPLPAPYRGKPTAAASSSAPGHPAAHALDGDAATSWLDDDNEAPSLMIDFGAERDLDALRIDWAGLVSGCGVEVSADGAAWRSVWTASPTAAVRRSYIDVPDTTTRWLRIAPLKEGAAAVGVAEVAFLTRPSGGENLGIWPLIAKDHPAHTMPRYFTGRQSSWTVLGDAEGTEEALVNEQGEVELWRGGPMLAPVVFLGGRRVEWIDEAPRLAEDSAGGGLPIVTLRRRSGTVTLTATALADGDRVLASYRLTNHGPTPVEGTLNLCLRPFQVNPPWQFLNNVGGVARVGSILLRGDELLVDASHSVALSSADDAATRLHVFDDGEAALTLGQSAGGATDVRDPHSAASAARTYPVHLGPGESVTWFVRAAPVKEAAAAAAPADAEFEGALARVRSAWSRRLGGAALRLPPGNEQLAASVRASLAYILINRDAAGFQPGSR